MTLVTRLTAAWIVTFALCGSSIAQTNRTPQGSPPASGISGEALIRERLNAWTIGLAGGLLEGAPIRFAAEIARVVDDGPHLHVLPIVTRGATENLNSLLDQRGVDTAIINSDAPDQYKIQVPAIRSRITYLLNLFP